MRKGFKKQRRKHGDMLSLERVWWIRERRGVETVQALKGRASGKEKAQDMESEQHTPLNILLLGVSEKAKKAVDELLSRSPPHSPLFSSRPSSPSLTPSRTPLALLHPTGRSTFPRALLHLSSVLAYLASTHLNNFSQRPRQSQLRTLSNASKSVMRFRIGSTCSIWVDRTT